jgi:hypothetical protein
MNLNSTSDQSAFCVVSAGAQLLIVRVPCVAAAGARSHLQSSEIPLNASRKPAALIAEELFPDST